MKPWIWLRTLAVLLGIFAIGHTLGTAAPKVTYGPQEAAVFAAMQGFRFRDAPLRMTTKKEMRRRHIKAFAGYMGAAPKVSPPVATDSWIHSLTPTAIAFSASVGPANASRLLPWMKPDILISLRQYIHCG